MCANSCGGYLTLKRMILSVYFICIPPWSCACSRSRPPFMQRLFGVTLWEVYERRVPFGNMPEVALVNQFLSGIRPKFTNASDVPAAVKRIIEASRWTTHTFMNRHKPQGQGLRCERHAGGARGVVARASAHPIERIPGLDG